MSWRARATPRSLTEYEAISVAGAKPSGLERLLPARHVLDPHQQPVAKGRHLVVHLGVELHSAPPAPPEEAQPHGHAVACVHRFLRVEPKLLVDLVEALPEADDLLGAAAGVRALMFRKHPLDLRMEILHGGLEVTPVVRGDVCLGLVDVLLRHSRCSMYPRWPGGHLSGSDEEVRVSAACRTPAPRGTAQLVVGQHYHPNLALSKRHRAGGG